MEVINVVYNFLYLVVAEFGVTLKMSSWIYFRIFCIL